MLSGPVNGAPVAVDDGFDVLADTLLSASVALNDSDPDDDVLSFALDTDVSNGTLVFNPDGAFDYTPAGGFFGQDSFSYTASDGNGGTDTAIVTIDVSGPVNGAPVAVDDGFDVLADTLLSASVALNDSDPDDDVLSFALDTDVSNGTLVFNPDGAFDYTPAGRLLSARTASATRRATAMAGRTRPL